MSRKCELTGKAPLKGHKVSHANNKSKRRLLPNFKKLAILRPALLLGKRKAFRLGERIAQFIMTKLSFIFIGKLKKFKPINARDVAKAINNISKNNYEIKFFESDKLLEKSKNN